VSDSDKIERRLRRLDAAVLHTKRRIETLSVVCERYHNIVAGAVISAEVSREQFTTAAQIAFRDPYRALKAWERREWRMANLLLEAPDEADAPGQVLAVIKVGKGGAGLSLRGRKRFGREDADRVAAHGGAFKLGRCPSRMAPVLASGANLFPGGRPRWAADRPDEEPSA